MQGGQNQQFSLATHKRGFSKFIHCIRKLWKTQHSVYLEKRIKYYAKAYKTLKGVMKLAKADERTITRFRKALRTNDDHPRQQSRRFAYVMLSLANKNTIHLEYMAYIRKFALYRAILLVLCHFDPSYKRVIQRHKPLKSYKSFYLNFLCLLS